ncbi:MAG: hypothetical protein J7639_06830 [Paenibacillaceae bacterium]|nr:hypothetical protein [Paenibacillaceae bacterium]
MKRLLGSFLSFVLFVSLLPFAGTAAAASIGIGDIALRLTWAQPLTYVVYDDLQPDRPVYVNDSATVYTEVGPYAGLSYIRTGGSPHKNESAKSFLSFTIDRDATVYVASVTDASYRELFNAEYWLAPQYGWAYTGDVVHSATKDTYGDIVAETAYRVYARTFPAGTVTLGAGNAAGYSGFGNMYAVFVGPAVGTPQPSALQPEVVPGAIPAFPGAEGGGKFATGGRGGDVYYVTNLDDSGPGSFRDAVSQGNRTVLFRVSGTIELESMLFVTASNLTIAGQSAPGDGIAFKKHQVYFQGDNQIVRFLRFRPGDGAGTDTDAVSGGNREQVIFDHISASWGTDETASFYNETNFTLQYSLLAQPIVLSGVEGKGFHGFGGIWGGENATYYYNLLAHNDSRNPRFTGKSMDVRNNVLYDWGYKSMYGFSEAGNMINNYYKAGISTTGLASRVLGAADSLDASIALTGNVAVKYDGTYEVSSHPNNIAAGVITNPGAFTDVSQAMPNPSPQDSAETAYCKVLDYAGASLRRDAVDLAMVGDVENGTGSLIYTAETVTPEQQSSIDARHMTKAALVWPTLQTAEVPTDTDGDGMPDVWEREHGLDPNDAADLNGDFVGDGYTNLETYLNELTAPAFPAGTVPAVPVYAAAGAPTGLKATAQDADSVKLVWNTTAGATGYKVYRALTPNGAYSLLTLSALGAAAYTDTGLTAESAYSYRVTAVSAGGESAPSLHAAAVTKPLRQPLAVDFEDGTVGQPYAAPADWPAAWTVANGPGGGNRSLAIPNGGAGMLTYDWTQTADRAHLRFDYSREANFALDKLLIYTGGSYVQTITDATYGLKYSAAGGDVNLLPGFQLNEWYTIALDFDFVADRLVIRTGPQHRALAVRYDGAYSAASDKITALRMVSQRAAGRVFLDNVTAWNGPAQPTGLAATPRRNEVRLAWDAVPGATGYTVYRADDEAGPYRKLATGPIAGTSYTVKRQTTDAEQVYRIRAQGASGEDESIFSDAAAVTVGGPEFPLVVDFNDGAVGQPYDAYPASWPAAWTVAAVPGGGDLSLAVPKDGTAMFTYNFVGPGDTAHFRFDYARSASFTGDHLLLYTGSKTVQLTSDATYGLKLFTGGVYTNLLPAFALNAWYTFDVRLDFAANTLEISAGPKGGTLTPVVNLTYNAALTEADHKLSAFRIVSQRANGSVYLDNIEASR